MLTANLQMNLDGKLGFIGCQNFAAGEKHRFMTIHRDVDEDLLLELFQNKGQFKSHVKVPTDDCARVLPPRQGGKGAQKCRTSLASIIHADRCAQLFSAYTHVDGDGNVLEGKIIHRHAPRRLRSSPRWTARTAVLLYPSPLRTIIQGRPQQSRHGMAKIYTKRRRWLWGQLVLLF